MKSFSQKLTVDTVADYRWFAEELFSRLQNIPKKILEKDFGLIRNKLHLGKVFFRGRSPKCSEKLFHSETCFCQFNIRWIKTIKNHKNYTEYRLE